MAIVRPFRGLRPRPEMAFRVACPPYDVLSTKEAREAAKDEPYCFLRVNKPEIEFADSINPCSPEVYKRGRENLDSLIADGIMTRDKTDCFYLYRLTRDARSQTGLVALTSVEEYLSGVIRKHEHTRPDKVRDRAEHILSLKAQAGPVLTAYRHCSEITKLFDKQTAREPDVNFVADDSVRHQLWVISDTRAITNLIESFSQLQTLYIADGHHRSEAAAEVFRRSGGTTTHPSSLFLSVLFADNELTILPYNRVVRDLNGLSLEQVLKMAVEAFDIDTTDSVIEPQTPHQFGMYSKSHWYRLTARAGSFDPHHPTESIDTAILFRNLMSPVLGIKDSRTDNRIGFVGGGRGNEELVRLVDSDEYQAAFSLYPTSVEQLIRVADAGEVMPPKSTWFEPKLRTGLVVNMLDND